MSKGSKPRKVDRKKWDDCPLWANLKPKKDIKDYYPNVCPSCGYNWESHEFGVPAPYCPAGEKV